MKNFLILIIIAPVLYTLLGTILGILLTILQTENLKLKIVLLAFLRPITYTYILYFLLPTFFDNNWIILSAFALAVVLRDIVFSNQKFLLNVKSLSDNISIKYINTFLQTKTIDFSPENNSILELSEMKTISNYPASLKIGDPIEPKRFIILSKKIWQNVNFILNAANKQLG